MNLSALKLILGSWVGFGVDLELDLGVLELIFGVLSAFGGPGLVWGYIWGAL